jgi:hypothetical protein
MKSFFYALIARYRVATPSELHSWANLCLRYGSFLSGYAYHGGYQVIAESIMVAAGGLKVAVVILTLTAKWKEGGVKVEHSIKDDK